MGGEIIRGYDEEVGGVDIHADRLGGSIVSEGPDHYMTHEGKHFLLAHYFPDVDTNGYGRIRFKTPADKYIHAVFFAQSTLGLTLAAFRDPGFTHAANNAIVGVNRNDPMRNDLADPMQEACHTPGGAGSGDVFVPAMASGIFTGGPLLQRDQNEFVLDLDTVYLIEVQSAADNNRVTLGVDYYYRSSN